MDTLDCRFIYLAFSPPKALKAGGPTWKHSPGLASTPLSPSLSFRGLFNNTERRPSLKVPGASLADFIPKDLIRNTLPFLCILYRSAMNIDRNTLIRVST